MSKRVMLIRHGRTAWNAERRYMGHTDMDLDDIGILQAAKTHCRLKAEKIGRVYASDSRRAYNFASMLFKGKAVVRVPDLREMNFGVLEGMTYNEVVGRYPQAYDEWLSGADPSGIPEGESVRSFSERVLRAFGGIVSSDGSGPLAIVTHAGPIRTIVNSIECSGRFRDLIPDHASISMIEYGGYGPRLLSVNDTSHLSGERDG
ncbi:MAG: histidine phosphatase family protein [Candidatus Omnitrophota bacterium]